MRAAKRKNGRAPPVSRARLEEMVEQATVDANGESEEVTGWLTMIDEHLSLPFETKILGVPAVVMRVDLDRSDQIVAVCARGRLRQAVPILDLPLPKPLPGGAEWIEAYRVWRGDR